jgi:hypothetical protein
MRKNPLAFALVLALAVTAVPAHGQGLELSGGVNFSKLSGDAVQDAARNTGLNLGLDFVIPVGPIGLNLGAGWSQKGAEETVQNSVNVIDLSYVEVPVHVRLPLAGAGPVRLNLVLGPTIGINTGCEIKVDAAAAQDCADVAQGGFDAEKIEWAGTGGLGVSFSLGGLAYAGVDLQYTLGLSNVSEGSSLDAKSRTFSLSSHLGVDVF